MVHPFYETRRWSIQVVCEVSLGLYGDTGSSVRLLLLLAFLRAQGTSSVWSKRVPLLYLELCLAVFSAGPTGLCSRVENSNYMFLTSL